MSKTLFIFHSSLFALFFLFCAYGQDDPRAQKIIDDMTAKFKAYPSVSLSFAVTITNLQDKTEIQQEGKLWVKNNKYKIESDDYVIYFDGSKMYQYLPKMKEVNISNSFPDDNTGEFHLLNPQTWFNISSQSFKTNLIKESRQDNRNVYEMDLYPVQIKGARYSRIRIMVEKSTLQTVYLKVFKNDGLHYALSFKPYSIHQTVLPDSFFVFNKAEHPDVEVIDLTF
jgi:outer membrane lipoprotein-sorting protein